MTDDYKQQITNHVRNVIQKRIIELKQEHPELLYTNQWRLRFPDGFHQSNNVIPVTTTTKNGVYTIGELHLVVPESFELDLEAMEFLPKNEPYTSGTSHFQTPPLDNSLEMLNAMVVGLNDFLSQIDGSMLPPTPQSKPTLSSQQSPEIKPHQNLFTTSPDQLETIQNAILQHDELPEWFTSIRDREVKEALLEKMAETYIQYRSQRNGNSSLSEFFADYTEYLKEHDKLQHYCSYKAKPVELNDRGWCTESYCSKKPYRSVCPRSTLQFAPPNTD